MISPSFRVARNDCVPCHGKDLVASAIALQTLADVQEQGELYASNYLHVKRHDSTVRRLPGERVVLEIGGPKIPLGERACTPDPQWAMRVQDHLEHGRIAELVEEATTSRLARAGNIGGELLNWIAMLGVVGDRKPIFIAPEIEHGHAYAAWRLD